MMLHYLLQLLNYDWIFIRAHHQKNIEKYVKNSLKNKK